MLRHFLPKFCVAACVALTFGGCDYTEEEKRAVCCVLRVRGSEVTPPDARVVINWFRSSDFDGNGDGREGPYGDGEVTFTNKNDKIRLEVARFIAGNRQSLAADYFVALGMTCESPKVISLPGEIRTRCSIELPVRGMCRPSYVSRPLTSAPIPEQFQQPFDAVLSVGVDVSANRVLGSSSRVYPVLGGHLCLRLP